MRTRDFAFVSLCYGRSGEEICMGYAMAASGRMQYDYKQNLAISVDCACSLLPALPLLSLPRHSG